MASSASRKRVSFLPAASLGIGQAQRADPRDVVRPPPRGPVPGVEAPGEIRARWAPVRAGCAPGSARCGVADTKNLDDRLELHGLHEMHVKAGLGRTTAVGLLSVAG